MLSVLLMIFPISFLQFFTKMFAEKVPKVQLEAEQKKTRALEQQLCRQRTDFKRCQDTQGALIITLLEQQEQLQAWLERSSDPAAFQLTGSAQKHLSPVSFPIIHKIPKNTKKQKRILKKHQKTQKKIPKNSKKISR